jgi:uncharacterized membrane protein YgaE (UPF0421/DUF939 family)
MAIERIIDTLIGIAVAVPINAAFPNRNKAKTDSISENEPSI